MPSNRQCLQAKGYVRWFGLPPALLMGMICLAASSQPASAMAADPLAAAFSDNADFKPMTKSEMASARGGFDGIAFGIFLSGTLSQPVTTTLPAGLTVSTLSPSQVQIIGGIGNLAGASGIFQFTNIVGDMNVVNNNIIINVSVQASSPVNAVTFIP